jgi:hypothetical protein
MNKRLNNILKNTLYVHKEIMDDVSLCSETRWLNKEVKDSLLLYKGDNIDGITCSNCVVLSLSDEFTLNNKTSLKMTLSTDIENVIPRPWPSVRIKLNSKDLSVRKWDGMSSIIKNRRCCL